MPGLASAARERIDAQTGFRFPDGTIQSTAATVTGGVPSVNGIPGAVTIVGNGGNTVSTASGTITVAGPYKRTIIVSPVPDNATASGTALITALASIAGNSATNRYLLKIEPGVYDLGSNLLAMKSYVDIEGSGPLMTRIDSARGGADNGTPADVSAVVGASSCELRDLTLVQTTSGYAGYAYTASAAKDARIANVTIHSSALGVPIAVLMQDSDVSASRLNVVVKGQQLGGVAIGAIGSSARLQLQQSSLLVDAGGTATNATGIVLSAGAIGTIDSSTVTVQRAVERAEGVSVNGGSLTITNSTMRVTDSSSRRGVETNMSPASKVDIHDSRILVGDSWNNPNIVALWKGAGSTLRAYSTLTDSASSGSPLCVLTYSYAGTTSCPAPS